MNLYSRYTYMSMLRRYMMLNDILKLYDGIMKTTTIYTSSYTYKIFDDIFPNIKIFIQDFLLYMTMYIRQKINDDIRQ